MKSISLALLSIAMLSVAACGRAEPARGAQSVICTLAERILTVDAISSCSFKPNSPGATVIVTEHGAVLFRKAYGLANMAENVALDPEISLRVGSITTQFTAAAIMLLAEQGNPALSEKIGQCIPDLPPL